MLDYNLSWIFYFQFNQKEESAKAFFSKKYQEKYELPNQLYELDQEHLRAFVHKYDYRKLEYFSKNEVKGYFDTLLRFKISTQKGYLRTQAICHSTKEGFTCMLFHDKELMKLQHTIGKSGVYPTSSVMKIAADDELSLHKFPVQMNQIKKQIVELLDRDSRGNMI
ncbi:MAG: hypothetical protein RBT45_00655 [Acholeplasmataceae bacterium]|jgi:hypothetical protein|nr:hypothetical protein [Acholeplasmataceae bacterium]